MFEEYKELRWIVQVRCGGIAAPMVNRTVTFATQEGR